AADQDLPVFRLGTQPCGEVADRANCGVAGALGKADLTQSRETLRDTHTKTKFAAVSAPSRDQFTGCLAHRVGHFDGPLGGVGDRYWVIEEHHDAVARELVERAFELAHEPPQSATVLT